jgi:predicted PurR-regulated permease PerM
MYLSDYFNPGESSEYIKLNPIRKTNRIRYDPLLTTLVTLFGLFFVVSFIYAGFVILPVIANFNQILVQIPPEITYYHNLASQQNQTWVELENNLSIVINSKTLKRMEETIQQVDIITKTLNVTQIQNELKQIVSILESLIPHK